MTLYHFRGFKQSLFPRKGKGIKMKVKVDALDFTEGLKKYYNEAKEELKCDKIKGPIVIPGDRCIVEDYIGEDAYFWELSYLKGV